MDEQLNESLLEYIPPLVNVPASEWVVVNQVSPPLDLSLSSSSFDPSLSGELNLSISGSFNVPIDMPPVLVTTTTVPTASAQLMPAPPPPPVMATFPPIPATAAAAAVQPPPVMATFPPLPPASIGVTRPRDNEPNGGNGGEKGKDSGNESETKQEEEEEKEKKKEKEKEEPELEEWMVGNPLLEWMSSPNRATRNLVEWDAARWRREGAGTRRWATDRMGLVERYDMVAQVICAMSDAESVWASAAHVRPRADALHWPRLCDLERGDDGAVLVRPETLVRPGVRGSFAALMHEVLGKRGVVEPQSPGEAFGFLFNYAADDFGASESVVREWRADVGDAMAAPLADVCAALERERDVPPACTRAVLHLLAERGALGSSSSGGSSSNGAGLTVTLQGFCASTRIFGRWWEGRMLAGLRELGALGPCFYIATAPEAEQRLRDTPQLACILRPRCKPDRGADALWPFALTMRVWPAGTIEHYVVSFAAGDFFVRDQDGSVTRSHSLRDLVQQFARLKCFRR